MNVLLMLIGVLIVYLAIKLVFRYNWNKGLGVALEFEKKHVVNGETVNVVEVISNEKRKFALVSFCFELQKYCFFAFQAALQY